MSDKIVPEYKIYRENTEYVNFSRPQCAQQQQNQNQSLQRNDTNYLSASSYSFNSLSIPPIGSNNVVYNQTQSYNIMYGTQSMYRNNTPVTYSQQFENAWIADPCLTAVSISDKDSSGKQMKLSTAQLSPASCCSSVDPLTCSPLPDFYKTLNKDIYGKAMLDTQWLNYSNQKYDFPSCSQLTSTTTEDCNFKFCQNAQQNTYYPPTNQKPYSSCQVADCSLYEPTCYDDKQMIFNDTNNCIILSDHDTFYSQNHVVYNENLPFDAIPSLDVKSPDVGGESDIIVEESEEDVDDSDVDDKKESTRCIICNVLNTPVGTQFFALTPESPLSMSSQKPVYKKLTDIVGKIDENISPCFLCSHCLALVNTIDHLENNLQSTKVELLNKYKNNVETVEKAAAASAAKKRKFKNLCGMHSFKCRICGKKFSMKTMHQLHMSKHKTKYKYLCEHCGKVFNKRFSFIHHTKVHRIRPKLIKAFVCDLCEKVFRTASNLKEHKLSCSGQKPHKCGFCYKHFTTSTQLKYHVRRLHDENCTFKCSSCSKGFVKLSDYKVHLLSHSNDRQYKCNDCNKTYKILSNLKHHQKSHNKILPFVCETCDKGFMRKEYLEAHVNTHNGLKPFACTTCDKTFASRKNLNVHTKTHTGNVKKKMCPICGKQIVHGLTDHMRIHSNEKEFECQVCFTKFNTKGALAKHVKKKHGSVSVVANDSFSDDVNKS